MLPLIFLILSLAATKTRSEEALLLDVEYGEFEELLGDNSDEEYSQLLTACPASTQQEKEFNKKVSLSGNSIFSRKLYLKKQKAGKIRTNICNKPFKPAMVYNFRSGKFEIGYELYYEDKEEIGLESWNESCYQCYRPVKNVRNLGQYEIIDQPTPPRDFVIRYEDGPEVKFNFSDGSQTLVFYWRYILDIKSSGYNKRSSTYVDSPPFTHDKPNKCDGYDLSDENIYSEENQEIYLKDILIPPCISEPRLSKTGTNQKGNTRIPPQPSCGQIYGCLKNSQIAPLQYFDTHAERFASCSHMNMIPVWKTIAKGQLRKVNMYTMAVGIDLSAEVVFGVSGVLKMKKTINPDTPQEIYLSDPDRKKIIPVPKIIYRIIEYKRYRRPRSQAQDGSKWHVYRYAAAIIIHNQPNPISNDERLCSKQSTLPGWDKITNKSPRTGLTYVCPVTVKLNDKLGAFDNITSDTFQPLILTAVPFPYNLTEYDPDDRVVYQDHTIDVYKHYKYIKQEKLA